MGTNVAPELLGVDPRGRPILLLHVARLVDVPARLGLPRPKFILLVAMDAEAVSHDARWKFAESVIDDGCVYLCAWGPECSWLDDDFDGVQVARDVERGGGAAGADEPAPEPHVMTTWHDGVPIEEAVAFWLESADPNPWRRPTSSPSGSSASSP